MEDQLAENYRIEVVIVVTVVIEVILPHIDQSIYAGT